jgi:hypothetical protein
MLTVGLICSRLIVLGFFVLDALVDFFTMDGHVFRGVNPNSDLIAFDTQHGNGDFVTYHQGFTDSASQYKHCVFLTSPLLRDHRMHAAGECHDPWRDP